MSYTYSLQHHPGFKKIHDELKALSPDGEDDLGMGEEEAHITADKLLVRAARLAGVPESIIKAYQKVEKSYS